MADATSTVAAPWSTPSDVARAAPKRFDGKRLLPVVGPLILFVAWDLLVRLGFIKPILLPTPMATLGALFTGLAGGPLLTDFAVTVLRTLEAFLIAAVIGVPLGVVLGSNEKAYRSVEFLIDFFRSTPSSALIPLFLLIFGVSDINKVLREVDVLIAPATPCVAPAIGSDWIEILGKRLPARPSLGLLTQPISFIGLPVCSVPVWGCHATMPIGVQLVAAPWREDLVLRVAHHLQRAGVVRAPVAALTAT